MKRRTRLGVMLAAAASSSAGVATGKPPIRLHCDLAVDPKKENEFTKYFDRVFRPVARKHQGFVDLKLLKLNTAVRGGVPSGGTFRFECAEPRQKWVASEDHAKAWPPMENMLTGKNFGKEEVSMKRLFLGSLLVAAFGCVSAFAQGSTGTTTITTTTNFVFPPLGLAPSETAAVSLVNIAPVPTSTTAAAPSCTGTVTFASSTGATIGKAAAFTVASGQIATVSLTATAAGITAARGEILASVQQTTTRPMATPCSLVFSLQTYDTGSGVTHLFLGNASATSPPMANPEPMR